MWLTIPAYLLTQMVPDLDPPAKRQHWHGTAGAASGSEECRPPGKGFRHSFFKSCASGFLCARHFVGSEPGSVMLADSPALSLTHPCNLFVQCHGFRDINCPSADLADRPQDCFPSCFILEPARNLCPVDPRQSQKELILGHCSPQD